MDLSRFRFTSSLPFASPDPDVPDDESSTSRPPLDPDASLPPPHITGKGVGIAAGLWLLYSLLLSAVVAQTQEIPFAAAVGSQIFESSYMALGSLPAWWITIRWMDKWHWGWVTAAHLLIGPLYAWGTVEAFIGTIRLGAPPGVAESLDARFPWLMVTHLTMYVIQFALYHLVRSVKRLRLKQQQTTELLARARKQELAALKAQVNPHFLFNTLNSISATLKDDPEQAREMIAKLAGLMRYALDSSDRDRVPLREEIDFVRRYLDLERHRFSDRLDTSIEVDVNDDTLDLPVPPMVLQPLVENALRHGIAPSEDGGTVRVRVAPTDERIRVQVDDTGTGADTDDPLSAESTGTGLPNTDARLKRTYGPAAALQTAPNEPSGFSVWFTLPRSAPPAD